LAQPSTLPEEVQHIAGLVPEQKVEICSVSIVKHAAIEGDDGIERTSSNCNHCACPRR
jgi:hypothetical protein